MTGLAVEPIWVNDGAAGLAMAVHQESLDGHHVVSRQVPAAPQGPSTCMKGRSQGRGRSFQSPRFARFIVGSSSHVCEPHVLCVERRSVLGPLLNKNYDV